MPSPLENLSGPNQPLRKEAPDAKEFAALKQSGLERRQTRRTNRILWAVGSTWPTTRRTRLCLAALRRSGYRSANRYIVFQVLPHTLGLGPEVWRVFATCHERRNRGEYEGDLYVDERLLADLIKACKIVAAALDKLPPI